MRDMVYVNVSIPTLHKIMWDPNRVYRKPVRCIETNDIFPSVLECKYATGWEYSSIKHSIIDGTSINGYHLEFLNIDKPLTYDDYIQQYRSK